MIRYRFESLVKKKGLSYRKLAEAIGLNFTTLHRLAKAKTLKDFNIRADTIDKICAFFNCKPWDFIEYKKSKEK